MWFEFAQNNSGGSFHVDDKLCHRIFIESNGIYEANNLAEDLGIYFNGCNDGRDCPCCGDRWSKANKWDEVKFPLDYDHNGLVFNTIEEYVQYLANEYGWTKPDARIYYKDGRVLEISKINSRS